MSDLWIQNLKPGMLVRIISSIEKQLIGKLAIVKEISKNSPRAVPRWKKDDDPFLEIEVLVYFPDIIDTKTIMVNRGIQFGKKVNSLKDQAIYYQKVFKPEHIAPPVTSTGCSMGKTLISKKVIRLNDLVYFPVELWRVDRNAMAGLQDWTGDGMVSAIGRIVRLQTNGCFNYDIEYTCHDGGLDVITKRRSEITVMDRDAARLWRLLYA